MDLTTQSPAEIDTALAALHAEAERLSHEHDLNLSTVAHYAGVTLRGSSRYRDTRPVVDGKAAVLAAFEAAVLPSWEQRGGQTALHGLRQAEAALEANKAAQDPLHAEYRRRGGWSRAFLVLNTGGHVHASMDCDTCFATTRFGWLPQVSGLTEAEIVAQAGSDACTRCYPSAPVDVLSRPRTVLHLSEQEAAQERAAKAEAKAARDAAKAAKAITAPGGGRLYKVGSRCPIETEVTAEREYVSDLAHAAQLSEAAKGSPEYREHWTDLAAEYTAKVEPLLQALAAKRGTTVEEQRAALARKVAAKVKRDAR